MKAKPPIEEVVLYQIDLTNKMAKQHSQKEFDQLGLGITIEQWVILKVVSEKEGLSQRELASQTYRDPASITRSLKLLIEKDLLFKEPDALNRKLFKLFLSKNGKSFIAKHMKMIQSLREQSTRGIAEKDLDHLHRILKKIQSNMS